MDFINFIGIDISKATFDFALIRLDDQSNPVSGQTSNNPSGIVKLQEFLKRQDLDMDKTLFCMEHTGIYCRLLSDTMIESKLNFNFFYLCIDQKKALVDSLIRSLSRAGLCPRLFYFASQKTKRRT